ncbi:MAG: PDZ domain-containing protein, partial [Luteimonas sp.]
RAVRPKSLDSRLRGNDEQKRMAFPVSDSIKDTEKMHPTRLAYVLGFALLLVSTLATAGERGYFGFGMSVTGSGFSLNPTVKRIRIASVVPGTPAAVNGIAVNDEIIKLEGVAIAGRKAKELKALASRDVGQTLNLELKRPDGKVYRRSLVAIKRPK